MVFPLAAMAAMYLLFLPRVSRSSGPLQQDVYVWQRAWNSGVTDSISRHGSNFNTVVPLAAEAIWERGAFTIVQTQIDFESLKRSARKVGLALRIGAYPGPYHGEGEPIEGLGRSIAGWLAEAETHELKVSDVHIDFDCPDSQLAGYRLWIEALRKQVRAPIWITALPSWLNQAAFPQLAKAANGFILQVHSLNRPQNSSERIRICDPAKALQWAELAARLKVPFKIALPTYGYQATYSADGKFLGASTEGPEPIWPRNSTQEVVRVEPMAMAELVRKWTDDRPALLAGIIWYRLPIEGDRFNWTWPTLTAVQQGRAPVKHWSISTRSREPGQFEVILDNDGELDLEELPGVRARWSTGRLIAGDGLGGYELRESGATAVEFVARRNGGWHRIRAGESSIVGWLRLDRSERNEIHIEAF